MKKLIYCLIGIMACGSVMGQGASSPESWQIGTASTHDTYSGFFCDTVITRTCGHSVTVTAARMIDEQNYVLNHRFFVRCMNSQNYFRFDILPSAKDTTYFHIDHNRYYIHDMRISDSICFFCGTKVTERRFLPDPLDPGSIELDTMITTGFFGRIDFGALLRDSCAMRIPETGDPNGSEAPIGGGGNPSGLPVPITEWHPRMDFALIPQTSALEKMWVENGIFVDGYKNSYLTECAVDTLYNEINVCMDTNFNIVTAHAYIIGRLSEDPNRSCLMEVTQGLRYDGITDTWLDLYKPEIAEEYLTDITGNDYRILFSSRIFKDLTADDGTAFDGDFTIGVRYKDNLDQDNSYRYEMHLYSHQNTYITSPLRDDEYGHLFRMKNYQYIKPGTTNTISCPNKDFGMIFTCNNKQNEYYGPTVSKTLLRSIDLNMEEDVAMKLGLYAASELPIAGGYKIADVAYIGNFRTNSIAVAYKTDGARSEFKTYHYMEIFDWGYTSCGGRYMGIGFDHSKRLILPYIATSLDMFMNGTTFQIGGHTYDSKVLKQGTQRRRLLDDSPLSCHPVENIYNDDRFSSLHAKISKGLIEINNYEVNWTTIRPLATKHDVDNNCTK